jgi:hypothetical protein
LGSLLISSNVFCWGKISQLGEKRKASVTHRKDFLEKTWPKVSDFKDLFSEIVRFRQ